jgi:protein-L-isoaspartate O-methyltransferase
MKAVDRADFSKGTPYYDAPHGIGYGVTISAPHMVNNTIVFSNCRTNHDQ